MADFQSITRSISPQSPYEFNAQQRCLLEMMARRLEGLRQEAGDLTPEAAQLLQICVGVLRSAASKRQRTPEPPPPQTRGDLLKWRLQEMNRV